ncbi:LacI family DNA-binding transcriptional regulator [Pendulispora albinea]|uniref:LacI family transcriptional regulator n=1 Tax=Pendulispora albinea TaxID=2741071 RepID=A0ABZ2M6M1_9BACT
MNDVAAAAGVALKTVSRVVNDEPGVNPATAEKVRGAIEALGFRRNDGARTLRRGHTSSIGVIVRDLADPFYSTLTRAVEEVALTHGFLVFTGSCDESASRQRELALAFCARRVDGIIIVPVGDDQRYLEPEIHAGVAAVFVDRPATNIDADSVLVDNVGGVRKGIEHLLARGHRRIGYIGDAPEIFTAGERVRGYRETLTAAGHLIDPSLIAMASPSRQGIRAALERMLLSSPSPATALFTGNSRITVTVLRELAELEASGQGLERRPALVSFDDFDLADLLTPGVTVIAQDPARIGRTAAELLFRRMEGGNLSPVRRELPTRLIPRGSGEALP